MPMVSTMPAMPGKVSVAPSSDSMRDDHRHVHGQRDVGDEAEEAVGDEHEDDDEDAGDDAGDLAGMDGILAEAGTDGALLDDGQRRRQRAGAQQHGEVVGALRR